MNIYIQVLKTQTYAIQIKKDFLKNADEFMYAIDYQHLIRI